MKTSFKHLLSLLALLLCTKMYGQHFDTAKVILGLKSLIYFDQNFGERRYQTDSLNISYIMKEDKSKFSFLNKSPEYSLKNWLFILRITNKDLGIALTGVDTSLILENRKLFCCAYIVAYNIRTEKYYRLNGFMENDANHFFADIKVDLHKPTQLLVIENLDIKCLYVNRKKKRLVNSNCMMPCEIRDNKVFHTTE